MCYLKRQTHTYFSACIRPRDDGHAACLHVGVVGDKHGHTELLQKKMTSVNDSRYQTISKVLTRRSKQKNACTKRQTDINPLRHQFFCNEAKKILSWHIATPDHTPCSHLQRMTAADDAQPLQTVLVLVADKGWSHKVALLKVGKRSID